MLIQNLTFIFLKIMAAPWPRILCIKTHTQWAFYSLSIGLTPRAILLKVTYYHRVDSNFVSNRKIYHKNGKVSITPNERQKTHNRFPNPLGLKTLHAITMPQSTTPLPLGKNHKLIPKRKSVLLNHKCPRIGASTYRSCPRVLELTRARGVGLCWLPETEPRAD